MNGFLIPKTEYRKLLQTQKELFSRINRLEKIIEELELEVKPSVLKRWEKQSKLIDQGKGKTFKSMKEFREHLKSL